MKTASNTDLILAIDLGQYKSVACLYVPTTAKVQFIRFTTGEPSGVSGRRVGLRAATRGLMAVTWTPASLSLLP
jgi:hypothetical protein